LLFFFPISVAQDLLCIAVSNSVIHGEPGWADNRKARSAVLILKNPMDLFASGFANQAD
jgi:hypothetical protein